MKFRIAITILLTTFLAGCSTPQPPQRRLELAEKALDTDGATTMLFHSSLYYPTELSLRFDGYIVGIEKSPKVKITTGDADLKINEISDAGLGLNVAIDKLGGGKLPVSETQEFQYSGVAAKDESRLGGGKLLYISHIIENQGERNGIGNCTIYNAYNQPGTSAIKQIAPACPDSLNIPIAPSRAYGKSWDALGQLEKSMALRIQSGKYSHIVVITMGWNTVQEEAVRNFNSIITGIKISASPNFNPLVIGVTWPSEWESQWFAPIYKLLSFPNKASDADELGLTWLGALLHQTIPRANENLPVVVIGHSFGSRASSVAACVGPAIYEHDQPIVRGKIDTLINLQGAFRSERLMGDKESGFHYPAGCKNVDNIVLTSSVNDKAMNMNVWGSAYAGDDKSYKKYCNGDVQKFRCAKADSEGHIAFVEKPASSNITYIDADDLIKENAYLSGGGAHSDIYRKEHGVMLNKLIAHQYIQNSKAMIGLSSIFSSF